MEDWKQVGQKHFISIESVLALIRNISILCSVKQIQEIGHFHPTEWEKMMIQRLGKEPLLRLLYIIFRDIEFASLQLDELLAFKPDEWIQAKEAYDIAGYYSKYPFAQFQPE